MADTLIDTDILIDFVRGQANVRSGVRVMIAERTATVSSVSVFELLIGTRTAAERESTEALLGSMHCHVLDREAAAEAAAIDGLLRAAGMRIDVRDCLIAGIAIANRLPLLTRNVRHFERVPGLEVVTV